jgi:hypothetical protein
MDSLLAKANVGAGTDSLAGIATPDGFAGAVVGTDGTVAERLATEDTLSELSAKINNTLSGALLTGTARDRFFENFHDFNTTNTWEVVQTGTGMTISGPLGGAAVGSSPYLNIASGTTINQKTIILSRATFSMPVDLRYQITASQRIANNRMIIGFVQVDPTTGAILTSTTYSTAPDVLNARNAAVHQHDGTVATTSQLRVRAAGSQIDTFANAFGTGFTTVATGTGPNWLSATTYGLTLERDKINTRAYGRNVTTNTGGQFSYDNVLPNPTVVYKLVIIVENLGTAPASSTDWRFHLINVMDATRFDVSPRNAGNIDGAKAFPFWSVGGTVGVTGSVTVSGTVTATVTAGTVTPVVPATPFILNSAATTNEALILTGTSGLQAFYATNTGAGAAYVKLYNKATAPVSADIPAMILVVPAAVSGVPGVCTLPIGFSGFRFALGLGIRITGGAADNDTTAVAAGQVKVILSRTV